MRQLLLHVGLHKTATSSFQETCGYNLDALRRQGIHYPLFRIENKVIRNHSVPLYSLFCENPAQYNINIKWGYSGKVSEVNALFRAQLDEALTRHDRVLLSGESISVLPRQSLIALKEYLEGRGFSLRVFCGVRKPYLFHCSEIQQRVRGGGLGCFAGMDPPRKSGRISALRQVFDDIEFFSFEQDCAHADGPVGALLERIGMDNRQIVQIRSNEGLGNITTRLYAKLNERYPVILDGGLNPRGRATGAVNFDDDRFLLTPRELSQVEAALDLENEAMRRLLSDEFTDTDYPTSGEFLIGRPLALDILCRAAQPPHVRDVIEEFLLSHGDGTWEIDELREAAERRARESTQGRIYRAAAALGRAFGYRRFTGLLRSRARTLRRTGS